MQDKVTFLKVSPEPRGPDEFPARRLARRVRSEELFAGADEIVIEHNGRRYLLRRMPLGGLVLTGLE
jgi:hemin uptake protein HemP